ncbi:hypothetical protein K435DRAFT_467026 [Dendrothele bispora CBS 962.96]|uniref:PH domain-containing protein n=1 Tax=Dendrothele bispora (strain CBS 962.96) TaxID=1314807 RepID=A0A4S8L0W2_DENBC|nr:hypothetical protein K435DRAFT_467026 [Dendrothele bispora CBS 962.96]
MEEPYPRSQSVMQTRSSGFQTKASKILQKVSNFRGRIRITPRGKAEDDSHLSGGPYMRQARSMDLDRHSKPFMSQPMLISNMLEPGWRDSHDSESHDAEGYSSSSSPQHSPACVGFNGTANHKPNLNNIRFTKATADDKTKQPTPRLLTSGPSAGTGVALGEKNVGFDGLPVSGRSSSSTRPTQSSSSVSRLSPQTSQFGRQPSGLPMMSSNYSDDFNPYETELGFTNTTAKGTDLSSRPPFSTASSTTSVKSLGKTSVNSTSTSTSDSFKSFTSESPAFSRPGSSMGRVPAGSGKEGITDPISSSYLHTSSPSAVTITQSRMREKELPLKPGTFSRDPRLAPSSKAPSPPSAIPPSKDSHSSRMRPSSPGPSPLSSQSTTKPQTSNAIAANSSFSHVSPDTPSPSKSNSSPSSSLFNSASSTSSLTQSKQPVNPSAPSQQDHRLPSSQLKRPTTSPASPAQFASFAAISEATPPLPVPVPKSPQQQTSIPTQTQSALVPRSSPSQRPTQAIPLPPLAAASSSLPSRSIAAPHPIRRPTMPNLTTPLPGHRFSLHLGEGDGGEGMMASARLSPSIIIRQPVLPLLNLPTLNPAGSGVGENESPSTRYRRPMTSPTSSGYGTGNGGGAGENTGGGGGGRGTARLKHMPALPMAGTGRGVTGREEDDMDEADMDSDDEDDMDDDEENEREHQDGLEDDEDGDDEESQDRHRERGQQGNSRLEGQRKGSLMLPMVDMSKFDLGSIFEKKPGMSKGKEKEVQGPTTEDSWTARTPTQTGGATPSGSKTPRHATSTGLPSSHTPSLQQQQDYFSVRVPPSRPSVSGTPIIGSMTPWGEKGKTVPMTPAPMPVPVPGRPGLYKHASKSMLDIPGFAVGSSSSSTSTTSTLATARPKTSGEALAPIRDGVLDGVNEMKRKKSREWIGLGKKKSRESVLKGEFANIKEGDMKEHSSDIATTPAATAASQRDRVQEQAKPAQTQSPAIGSNRDDLILEEPRRLGGAAIAAAAANIVAPTPVAGHESSLLRRQPSTAHASEMDTGTLTTAPHIRRRRSMPSFTASSPPPPYPAFPLKYHTILQLQPSSYESPPMTPPPTTPLSPSHIISALTGEEGTEKLPGYSNEIYLRAIMPRKSEFLKPGVQAKDRKWRRVICELEGTVFRVYRCPPEFSGQGKVADWWERKVGVGDLSVGQGIGGGTGASGDVVVSGTRPGVDEEQRKKDEERAKREKLEGEGAGQTHAEIRLPRRLSIFHARRLARRRIWGIVTVALAPARRRLLPTRVCLCLSPIRLRLVHRSPL